MHVLLQVTSGPAAGARIVVRRGQIVRVGRTAWADFSLSADASLSDVHFAVEYDRRGAEFATWGAGRERPSMGTSSPRRHFARVTRSWQAKRSLPYSWKVKRRWGAALPVRLRLLVRSEKTTTMPRPKAADYCRHVELSEPALEWLRDDSTPLEYFDLLVTKELFADAVRFLAGWLPKTQAVRWAGTCLQKLTGGRLSGREAAALEAALVWSAEPNEEHRRAAQAVAEKAPKKGPATWLATAAFWSGGSLAPPELAEAPPAEGLTAKAVTACAPVGDSPRATRCGPRTDTVPFWRTDDDSSANDPS